jgi:hypothetical protein
MDLATTGLISGAGNAGTQTLHTVMAGTNSAAL